MKTPNLKKLAEEAGDDVDGYLQAPTDEHCRHCGQGYLRRFEVLNDHTCERCRLAYLVKKEASKQRPVMAP